VSVSFVVRRLVALGLIGLATVCRANCHDVVTFVIEADAVDIAKQTLRDGSITDVFTDSNGYSTILILEEESIVSAKTSMQILLDKVTSLNGNFDDIEQLTESRSTLSRKANIHAGVMCAGIACFVLGGAAPGAALKVLMWIGGGGTAAIAFVRGQKYVKMQSENIGREIREIIHMGNKIKNLPLEHNVRETSLDGFSTIANMYSFDSNRHQIAISATAEDRPALREKLIQAGFNEIKTPLIDIERRK